MKLANPNACVRPVKQPIIIADEQAPPRSFVDLLISELERSELEGDAHD